MTFIKQTILLFLVSIFIGGTLQAQAIETVRDIDAERAALEAQKAELAAEVAKYSGELAAVDAKLKKLPGWRTGLVGVVGFDLNGNNNWYALATPNSRSNGIGIGVNAFANNIQDKFFWRNLLNVTIQRTATRTGQLDADGNDNPVIALSEGLDLSSLYGYRINPKWAVSAEGKYTTSLIRYLADDDKYEASINDPGKLTISAGLTWTPTDNLVVLIHPLGYELNMPGELISAPGAKIGAVYTAEIFKNVAWSSNLSAFIPYGGAGDVIYDTADPLVANQTVNYGSSDLINYTWINGFSMKIFNGIAVALNVGLRGDNQIADKGKFALANDVSEVEAKGLNLQSYYTLGLGYTF